MKHVTITQTQHNVFYFTQSTSAGKIPVEYVFNWRKNYKLNEKEFFKGSMNKIFSSNYNKYIINNSMYDEVYINGKSLTLFQKELNYF